MTSFRGESPTSMQFSTMSTLEARIFEPSPDPASELKSLFAALETERHTAHMRIAGILATMGQRRHLERVRRHFALALTEAELELHVIIAGGYSDFDGGTAQELADRCGILAYCLGETCERIGRTTEARTHFQRGVGYYNVRSALKLSLYAKMEGRLDDALFLLTSASEETDPDVGYLLGDHFWARKDFDRARGHLESAADLGQVRATERLKELDLSTYDSVDSGVDEHVELGLGWTATIDHVEGGVHVSFEDRDVDFLAGNSLLTFIDHGTIADREATWWELGAHRVAVDDLKKRTLTFKDASRTGLLQVRAAQYHGTGTVAAVIDHSSGSMQEYVFDDLPSALRELNISPESIARPSA